MYDAVARAEAAFSQARTMPPKLPFQDRIQVALALADLYMAADQAERARELLRAEAAFAEQLVEFVRRTGSPHQLRAALAGRWQLRDRATQLEIVGQAAPEIEVTDWVLGKPTSLAEQRGRVVLIEFWAGWCRPCLAMFPVLANLHRRYEKYGLTIIALTRYACAKVGDPTAQRKRERETISRAVADRNLEIGVGIAPDGRLQQRYGAVGVPVFALIDRAGVVQFAPPTPEKDGLERAIANLLGLPVDQSGLTL